jgi:ATP-dependent DNA helicase RecG
LLTGNLKAKEKRIALEKIASGEANFIVGTHSLISDNVNFKNLGLCIVDEEHRFGVAQRDRIRSKLTSGIHTLSMSATPIPRTLGVSLYGEGTDIYTISKMPNGRKPVETTICTNVDDAYDFIHQELEAGRQAYIICPLIEESDNEKMAEIESVEKTYQNLINKYKNDPLVKIAMVNGKMKQSEVTDIIQRFKNKEFNIVIATTIIEVGVNVPNSTVILIKNAERFGLAQLHQLRGRVGRGSFQSYCILNTAKEDVERLEVMTQTTNGFKIAEEDLRLRGMGDFLGTKQSGDIKNVMLMLANRELYNSIKSDVKLIFQDELRYNHYYKAGF